MAENTKINVKVIILGSVLVVIFLSLIVAVNTWVKVSLDEKKPLRQSSPVQVKEEPLTSPVKETSILKRAANIDALEDSKEDSKIKTSQKPLLSPSKVLVH